MKPSELSRLWALVLAIALGPLGVHRFYLGRPYTGVLWLLTGGLFTVGWLADCILLVPGWLRDHEGKKLPWRIPFSGEPSQDDPLWEGRAGPGEITLAEEIIPPEKIRLKLGAELPVPITDLGGLEETLPETSQVSGTSVSYTMEVPWEHVGQLEEARVALLEEFSEFFEKLRELGALKKVSRPDKIRLKSAELELRRKS